MAPLAKTTGIERHPRLRRDRARSAQKEVWTFAKAFAQTMERLHPEIVTAEYRIAKRPPGRVLVDYNQDASGQTLASVYSVRPRPLATVSTPVRWDEVEAGIEIDDFRLDNVRERFARSAIYGHRWRSPRALRPAPLLGAETRTSKRRSRKDSSARA